MLTGGVGNAQDVRGGAMGLTRTRVRLVDNARAPMPEKAGMTSV